MAWTLLSVPLPPKYNYKPWKGSKSQPRQNSERWKAEEGRWLGTLRLKEQQSSRVP